MLKFDIRYQAYFIVEMRKWGNAEIVKASTSYESYTNLDELGRCGVAIASVGQDIMPTEKRGSIGSLTSSPPIHGRGFL